MPMNYIEVRNNEHYTDITAYQAVNNIIKEKRKMTFKRGDIPMDVYAELQAAKAEAKVYRELSDKLIAKFIG